MITEVTTALASLDCYTPEQLLGRLPPRMFHKNTVRGRLSLRQSDGYGKARKAALRQCFYGRFLGKVSLKLLRCIIVEACQVGDYRSYYRLMHSAPAPAHTPAQPDHRRQPMRWTPLRTIAEVTPVLYPAPVAAPSLAEYSKGSSTLCDGDPFG